MISATAREGHCIATVAGKSVHQLRPPSHQGCPSVDELKGELEPLPATFAFPSFLDPELFLFN